MPNNLSAVSTHDNVTGFRRDIVKGAESPYVRLYEEVLRGLDSPFAHFLKRIHGVSGAVKVSYASGVSSYSIIAELEASEALHMLARDSQHPYFKDCWARALTYRYRPLEEATPKNRADNTVKEVIQHAEEWVNVLYKAMRNVTDVNNKSNSVELNMFKSASLDKKTVEAACRSILIALVHRCIVGFCGLRTSACPSREDRKLTCKERLFAIKDALRHDKRICKDVMTEDSKICFLVHAPLAVSKCKKNQEKGNDVKRGLLAEAAAARRKALGSPIPLKLSQNTHSRSSNTAPISTNYLPNRQGPIPVSLISNCTPSHAALTASMPSLSQDMSVLSSSGFVALNEEYTSKKRSRVKMENIDIDHIKCARV